VLEAYVANEPATRASYTAFLKAIPDKPIPPKAMSKATKGGQVRRRRRVRLPSDLCLMCDLCVKIYTHMSAA
jgi:hypothetical protein